MNSVLSFVHEIAMPALLLVMLGLVYVRRRQAAWIVLTSAVIMGLFVAIPLGVKATPIDLGAISRLVPKTHFAPSDGASLRLGTLTVKIYTKPYTVGSDSSGSRLFALSHLGPIGWHTTKKLADVYPGSYIDLYRLSDHAYVAVLREPKTAPLAWRIEKASLSPLYYIWWLGLAAGFAWLILSGRLQRTATASDKNAQA